MADLLSTLEPATEAKPYTVLARRYRSTTFDEVVGQDAIAATLKNAIARGRTAHAYLFTGTRGVGKTSMARIFAKTLNVRENLREKDAIAAAILRGDDIDVIEIDAASNRGIDEVRDLIANAGLQPARSPFKIYIIDEVHMLTRESFNALLKIMEEPPSHVKFILCTTEVHKVPATIQSRCQRFDFRNIAAGKIAAHLRDVLKKEKIEADTAVVAEIARLANGSMRDGLSLLDRLIAAGDGRVTTEVFEATLGAPDHAIVARIVDGIVAADPRIVLETANDLLSRGTSLEQALNTFAEHFRTVMVIAVCGKDSELVELFGEARESAVGHATKVDVPTLVHWIALCESAARNARFSSVPRAMFEAVLVRLALAGQLIPVHEALRATGSGAEEKKKSLAEPKSGAVIGPVAAAAPILTTQSSASEPVTRTPVAAHGNDSLRVTAASLAAADADPFVQRVKKLFNATVVDVRPVKRAPGEGS